MPLQPVTTLIAACYLTIISHDRLDSSESNENCAVRIRNRASFRRETLSIGLNPTQGATAMRVTLFS